MQSSASVKRRYQSPLRDARALETRRAIVDSARQSFIAGGYVATSVDTVASSAGVSRALVFATFGGKAALLKAAYDSAFGEGDERTPLRYRPEAQAVLAERDPRRYLAAYVEMIAGIFASVAPIHEVVRAAAPSDAGVAQVWDAIGEERLAGSRRIVGHVEERGGLRPGLDATVTADVIWVLNDPGLYHMLVLRRGWTTDAYRHWLTTALERELL
jgi:AcrR family transcriptional regulator